MQQQLGLGQNVMRDEQPTSEEMRQVPPTPPDSIAELKEHKYKREAEENMEKAKDSDLPITERAAAGIRVVGDKIQEKYQSGKHAHTEPK